MVKGVTVSANEYRLKNMSYAYQVFFIHLACSFRDVVLLTWLVYEFILMVYLPFVNSYFGIFTIIVYLVQK